MAETDISRRQVLKTGAIVTAGAALGAFTLWPRPQAVRRDDRIQVRYWHMWTAEWQTVVEGIVEVFNQSQSRIEVIPLSVPGSVGDTKFLLGTVGGDPPDVMTHWGAVVPTWGSQNLLTPLDGLMSPAEWADFRATTYPVAKKVGMFEDRLYGVTIGLNAFGLYYLPEHFEEAGLDPDDFPKTLEALVEASQRLHQRDARGNLTRLGYVPSGFVNLSEGFGGGLWDWEKGELALDSEANLRAMRYIVQERKRVGFEDVNRFFSGLNSQSFAAGWPFIGKALSCTFDGQWRVEQLRKYAPDLKYRTIPLPPPEGGVPLAGSTGGNFMIIPQSAKHKEAAWEFIRFWSGLQDPVVAADLYTRGGWLPINPRVAEAPDYVKYRRANPEFDTFVTMLASPKLVANPPVPYQVYLVDQAGRSEDFAIRGTWGPEEAIRMLRQNVEGELARRKAVGYAL